MHVVVFFGGRSCNSQVSWSITTTKPCSLSWQHFWWRPGLCQACQRQKWHLKFISCVNFQSVFVRNAILRLKSWWFCQKLHHVQYSRGGDCPREKKIRHLQVQRFWRSWPLPHLLEVDHWECQTYRPHCYSWAASPISVDLNLNVCISRKHMLQIALF